MGLNRVRVGIPVGPPSVACAIEVRVVWRSSVDVGMSDDCSVEVDSSSSLEVSSAREELEGGRADVVGSSRLEDDVLLGASDVSSGSSVVSSSLFLLLVLAGGGAAVVLESSDSSVLLSSSLSLPPRCAYTGTPYSESAVRVDSSSAGFGR